MTVIEKKTILIEELNEAKLDYIKKDIAYRKEKCELMLNTDFVSVLESSRPTVDEKKAYVELNTLELKEAKDVAYSKVKYIEMKISICDDRIIIGN